MAVQLTNQDCEFIAHCYTRKHYAGDNIVPVGVIQIVLAFLHFWQRIDLTERAMGYLRDVATDQSTPPPPIDVANPFSSTTTSLFVTIPLPSIKVEEQEVELQLVSKMDDWTRRSVSVRLEIFIPDDVLFFGGHFGIRERDGNEDGVIENDAYALTHYQRLTKNELFRMDEYEGWSEEEEEKENTYNWCRVCEIIFENNRFSSSSPLELSHFIDIEQIKYATDAGIADVDMLSNIDLFSVGNTSGHYQWVIDGIQLADIQNNIEDFEDLMIEIGGGWQLSCSPGFPEIDIFCIILRPPFFPINLCGIDVKMEIKSVMIDKNGKSTSIDNKEKILRQNIHSSGVYQCFGIYEKHIEDAISVQLDIEWEVVEMSGKCECLYGNCSLHQNDQLKQEQADQGND